MYVNVHICQYGEYTLKQQDTRHRAASLDGCLSTVSAFRQLTPAGAALASDEVAVGTSHDSGTGGASLHSGVCLHPCFLSAQGAREARGCGTYFPGGQGRQPSVAARVIPMAPAMEHAFWEVVWREMKTLESSFESDGKQTSTCGPRGQPVESTKIPLAGPERASVMGHPGGLVPRGSHILDGAPARRSWSQC